MKLRYDLTAEDLQAFRIHHARTSADSRAATAMWRYFATAIVFYGMIGILAELGGPGDSRHAIAFVIALAFFFGMPALARMSQRGSALRYAKAHWRQVGTHEMEALPDVLVQRGPAGEQRIPWDRLERIESHQAHAFIYLDAATALVIPSATVREGDYDAFVQALRARFAATPGGAATAAPPPVPPRNYLRPLGGAALLLAWFAGACLLLTLLPDQQQSASIWPEWPYSAIILGIFFLCIVGGTALAMRRLVRRKPGLLFGSADRSKQQATLRVFSGVALILFVMLLVLDLRAGSILHRLPTLLLLGLQVWFFWQVSSMPATQSREA